MKPKNFRFESLLRYKTFVEETMREELSDLSALLDIEEKRLFGLEEIWGQAVEELRERQARHTPPHEILMYHTYLQQISFDIEAQRKRVIEAQKAYDEKRESLVRAAQERKIVEKVKEKDGKEIMEETNRAEKKVMDETAKNKYLRDNC